MILYLAGLEFNTIEKAELITVSSEDALFLKEFAYDGFPGNPFKFLTNGVDDTYDIDLNSLLGGGFEGWDIDSVPNHWEDISVGDGNVSEEETLVAEGSSAIKINEVGGGEAGVQQDVSVISGQSWNIDGRIRGEGVNPTVAIIQCLETGEFLTPTGEWQLAPVNFISRATASYSTSNIVNFTIRPFSITHRHRVTIRVKLLTETGIGYADAWYLWPDTNFASLHGHNLGTNIVMKIQSDDDDSYGSPVTNVMVVSGPTAYKTFDLSSERYWRFLAEGTNFEAIRYGELVLGQYKILTPDFQPGSEVKFIQPRSKFEAANMQVKITNISDFPVREYSLEFMCITEAEMNAIRDEVIFSSGLGKDEIVIVPDDNNSEVVYGRYIDDDWSYTRNPSGSESKGMYDYRLRIREDPLGLEIE